jgi:HSP20 family protein
MRTISPLTNVFDRMVTLSRAMDDVVGANGNESTWAPALDAGETEHGWVVDIDLPGVAPESVDVVFDRNALTVRGTRQRADTEKSRPGIRERAMGAFERTLRFPQHVDSEKISAEFRHGVLTITVPKAESARPRKIAVQGNGIR